MTLLLQYHLACLGEHALEMLYTSHCWPSCCPHSGLAGLSWLPNPVHYETPAIAGLLPVFHPVWSSATTRAVRQSVELCFSAFWLEFVWVLSRNHKTRMTRWCWADSCGHVFCVAPCIFTTGFQSAYYFAVHVRISFSPDHQGPWKDLKVNFSRETVVIAPGMGLDSHWIGKLTLCSNVSPPAAMYRLPVERRKPIPLHIQDREMMEKLDKVLLLAAQSEAVFSVAQWAEYLWIRVMCKANIPQSCCFVNHKSCVN